ncbi:hypothetical protein [Ensifer sp. MJa1]|uniref:hypothetical protein n=1 Tax=Ensifer sp. MJa1 TaxID=2919888 RepID=UPI0030080FD3
MSLTLASPSAAEKATTMVTVVAYRCEQGPLSIINAKKVSGEELVYATLGEKAVQMSRLKDRAEEMYVSLHADAGSYRWRVAGQSGALSWLGPEADAREKVLFGKCEAAPAD